MTWGLSKQCCDDFRQPDQVAAVVIFTKIRQQRAEVAPPTGVEQRPVSASEIDVSPAMDAALGATASGQSENSRLPWYFFYASRV